MIPLAIPNLAGNEGAYLQECVATNFVSSVGPYVDRFEDMVASLTGAKRAIATCSGTTGLQVALTAVGVSQGDLVILPTLTFIASANAISHCGAMPWLLDISQDNWTLCPDAVRSELEMRTVREGDHLIHRESGRRVAAMMPVYTLGSPALMDSLTSIAREFRLPVVADAAAAIGAHYNGREIGDLGADLSVLSFNGNKTVTSGGGGAVIGSNEPLCALVKHLTTTARSGPGYIHDRVGFNFRMTNIAAAVGCAQLENVKKFVDRKKEIAAYYNSALTELDGVSAFPQPEWSAGSCWFSGVYIDPGFVRASDLSAGMHSRDVDARTFWRPIHLQAPYANAPKGDLSVAESVWENILVLPCSTSISESELNTVVDVFRQSYEEIVGGSNP